jgi:prevent-host-death family protein
VKKVNLAQARDSLSSLVDDAAYRRERIVLQSRGKPKAALIGLDDLAKLEAAEETDGRARKSMMLRWLEDTEKMLKRRPRVDASSVEALRQTREDRDVAVASVRRRKRRSEAARKRAR